jgi:hypothetical protein
MLPANHLHKAFELVSFVDKLPLVIESFTCYDNFFILGTSTGRMLIYEVKPNPLSPMRLEASFEKSVAVTKKPIQQLAAIKNFKILVALFDAQIHVFDLNTYQLQSSSLLKTKGCSLFATSVAKSDERLLRLVVACKKKLQFYYWSNGKFMDLQAELELADVPRTLEITRDNLVVYSLRKEFFYYELATSSSVIAGGYKPPSEAKFTMGSRLLEPLCQKLSHAEDSFIVGVDENKTILYDSSGKPSLGYSIAWSSSPSAVAGLANYLIAILPASNSIEVATVQPTATCVQVIESFTVSPTSTGAASAATAGTSVTSSSSYGPSSVLASRLIDNVSSLTSGLVSGGASGSGGASSVSASERLRIVESNGNSVCYVCNQNNVWCLLPVRFNEQLEQVLRCKTYELGIGLISSQMFYNNNNGGISSSSKTSM